ncbi:box C/D snoRNA protein 1-like isoform X2 [Clavelina lepadiformis]|uniref:box C/D snoRNA protein 1-like isoform X2 n=1 Tax=Clavelina lepadiformis TaxID=159417 RepID=UPI004040EB27
MDKTSIYEKSCGMNLNLEETSAVVRSQAAPDMKKESISGCCEHHSTVSVEPQDENEDCLKSIETEKCQFPDSATSGDRSPMKENDVSEQTNMCWSCRKNVAKYKCPKCSTQTCSVACVKHHKTAMNCDGIRCKTSFVGKEHYNENNLLSDYRFLEEVNRCACKNDRGPHPYNGRSKSMKLQIGKAASMNISLKLLPPSFSMRKQNSTFYCYRRKGFLWHTEWIFFNSNVTKCTKRFPDDVALNEGIKKFTSPQLEDCSFDPRLTSYSGDRYFFMKMEGLPANTEHTPWKCRPCHVLQSADIRLRCQWISASYC